MKETLRWSCAALACMALVGCASTQSMSAGKPAVPASSQPGQSAPQRDSAYVASVERVARMRGVDVRWVNPPVKRRPPAAESEVQ